MRRVSYEGPIEPIKVVTWVRQVSAAQAEGPGEYNLLSWTGFPPRFTGLDGTFAGDFAKLGDKGSANIAHCGSTGFTELDGAVEYDARGFHLDGLTVAYTIGSGTTVYTKRKLEIDISGCGTANSSDDICSR